MDTIEVAGAFHQAGMVFPEVVANLRRVDIASYGSRASGHSVSYQSPSGTTISVYVYGFGGDNARELDKVWRGIQHVNKGTMKLTSNGPVTMTIGGRRVAGQGHIAQARARDLITQTMIFSAGGYFIKYRITATSKMLATDMTSVQKLITSLVLPP